MRLIDISTMIYYLVAKTVHPLMTEDLEYAKKVGRYSMPNPLTILGYKKTSYNTLCVVEEWHWSKEKQEYYRTTIEDWE